MVIKLLLVVSLLSGVPLAKRRPISKTESAWGTLHNGRNNKRQHLLRDTHVTVSHRKYFFLARQKHLLVVWLRKNYCTFGLLACNLQNEKLLDFFVRIISRHRHTHAYAHT